MLFHMLCDDLRLSDKLPSLTFKQLVFSKKKRLLHPFAADGRKSDV